jgi:glycosyltransferase involved in cell wall biosynthesis
MGDRGAGRKFGSPMRSPAGGVFPASDEIIFPAPIEKTKIAAPLRQDKATGGPKIVAVGFLPPPIDGQRLITARMFDRLAETATLLRLDLDRFQQFGRMSKLISTFNVCTRLMLVRHSGFSRLYLAPHSGSGLLLSCAIVLLARLLRFRLFIHYHSYKNLSGSSGLMESFLALCGKEALHIVLAPPMAQALQHHYKSAKRVTVLSNTVFVPRQNRCRSLAGGRLRVGHISNLSKSKGLVAVIECMRRLASRHPGIELVLAGPPADEESRQLISEATEELGGRLTYLGRLAADAVARFYQNIEVFLFPTVYEHEAEPLVLIEAVSFGVTVIATDRGCIRYLLGPDCGLVLDANRFVDDAVEQIVDWAEHPDELAKASVRAFERFTELHRNSLVALEQLLTVMATEEDG